MVEADTPIRTGTLRRPQPSVRLKSQTFASSIKRINSSANPLPRPGRITSNGAFQRWDAIVNARPAAPTQPAE